MVTPDKDITLFMIMQHMQTMEQRLLETTEKRFAQVDVQFNQMDVRFDRLERIVDHNHVQTMASLDTIDERLDDVEVVQVPRLKKAVGMK